MSTRELYIFGKAFDLPSIDPQCLALISYLGIVTYGEYKIIECNDAVLSPTGELPMLRDGKTWVAGTNRIVAYLARTGHNADEKLTRESRALSVSYQALVDETLANAILFSWFADSENFVGVVREAYSALLPFPARYYVPTEMKKKAVRRVKKYGGTVDSGGSSLLDTGHTKIYDAARECYRVLDRRLGDQDFFFGQTPTSLDAKAFGYMALQLYPEIPNPRFQMILTSQFPRLIAYCDRCRERFLKDVPKPSTGLAMTLSTDPGVGLAPTILNSLSRLAAWSPVAWLRTAAFGSHCATKGQGPEEKDSTDNQKEKSAEQQDFERKRILAVGLGVLTMIGYVIMNGLVVISAENRDDSEGSLSLEEEVSFEYDDNEE